MCCNKQSQGHIQSCKRIPSSEQLTLQTVHCTNFHYVISTNRAYRTFLATLEFRYWSLYPALPCTSQKPTGHFHYRWLCCWLLALCLWPGFAVPAAVGGVIVC